MKGLAALILLFVLSGCGTVVNIWLGVEPDHPKTAASHYNWGVYFGDTEVYGGIRNDAHGIGEAACGENGFWWSVFAFPVLVFIDFPLSLVGDTLTLPYTIPYVLTREEPKASSP